MPEALHSIRARRIAAACLGMSLWACSGSELDASGPVSAGLVFVRSAPGSAADLARVRISDAALSWVARTPQREERWPYWSEHARKVVFQARPEGSDPRTDLLLWDPESGEETHLTPTPDRDERWPAWSPTEARLAYAFRGGDPAAGMVLLDLESGESEVLARSHPRWSFYRPAFSPDGGRIVASKRARDSANANLWLLRPGRKPRRLTREDDRHDDKAFFTRDGSRLVFTARQAVREPGDLAQLDLATREVRFFASDPAADDHSVRPSPRRDEVAFVSDREGSEDVFLVDLKGGVPRNLTRSPERDEFTPRWSPDGELLVLTSDRAIDRPPDQERDPASLRLLVIDRDGRVLLETPGRMPDWMPPWR
jgi:Tol biopolymer transport system component